MLVHTYCNVYSLRSPGSTDWVASVPAVGTSSLGFVERGLIVLGVLLWHLKMAPYEIFAWDGNRTYLLIMSCRDNIEDVHDLAEAQGLQTPIVRQYNAAEDVLYGWDYLDSIIRMSGGGHFLDSLERYTGSITAEELFSNSDHQRAR